MDQKEKKKIFLSGARGFIGRNILEQLSGDYDFFCPSRQELDLTDASAVREYLHNYPVDVVIHAANIGGTRKTAHLTNVAETNLKMFFNIARCEAFYGKMIFLGSGAEYDKSRDLHLVSEEEFDKKVPRDDYGFAKYICSKYIEKSEKNINLRCFGVYGKYEDPEIRFISSCFKKILNNRPIEIYQDTIFDYIYIQDMVRIIDFFINNRAKYKFYNVGTGKPISLKTIAERCAKLFNPETEILVRNQGQNKEYSCNNSRLMAELKDFEFISFDDSLKQLYSWYKNN